MTDSGIPAASLEDSADLLRVLGHPLRLELLTALIEGERAVGDIESVTGVGQPLLSQQLAILRKGGLVSTRREAKQIFYQINRDRMAQASALLDRFAGTVALPRRETAPTSGTGGSTAAMFPRIG